MKTTQATKHLLSTIPALVLCGGKATRLLELTEDRIPKALVEVGGKTLLDHTLELLSGNGIRRIILALSHHSTKIRQHVGCSGNDCLEINFSETEIPLGIIPSIIKASAQFTLDSTFLIAGADEICEGVCLEPVYQFHRESKSIATMVLSDHVSSEHSSLKATLDVQGHVTSLARGIPISEFTATGISFLEPEFIRRASRIEQDGQDPDYLLNMLLPQLISERRVHGVVCPMKRYVHVSTPTAYAAASQSYARPCGGESSRGSREAGRKSKTAVH